MKAETTAPDLCAVTGRVFWLDGLRGLAIIWIFLVHVARLRLP
jgi:hypothetical protein